MAIICSVRPERDVIAAVADDEPQTYAELMVRLRSNFPEATKLLKEANNLLHRLEAATLLRSGEPHRIIGTLVGGKAGGLLFHPFHLRSINRVVAIKSLVGSPRQALFALVCNKTTVAELIDTDLSGDIDLDRFAGDCFLRLPVKRSIDRRLPQEFRKVEGQMTFVQFYIPEPRSILEEIIEIATVGMDVPAMAGTSANYTSQSTRIERHTAATFCLENGIVYLDAAGHPDRSKRGSYAIVKMFHGEMILERHGNISFAELQGRLASR